MIRAMILFKKVAIQNDGQKPLSDYEVARRVVVIGHPTGDFKRDAALASLAVEKHLRLLAQQELQQPSS